MSQLRVGQPRKSPATMTMRRQLFLVVSLVVVLVGGLCAVVGVGFISRNVRGEAERQLRADIRTAWSVYDGRLSEVETVVKFLTTAQRVMGVFTDGSFQAGRERMEPTRLAHELDLLTLVDTDGRVLIRSHAPQNQGDSLAELAPVRAALAGHQVRGTILMPPELLARDSAELVERAYQPLRPTPRARPTDREACREGMLLVAAAPVRASDGRLLGAILGGVLLNRDFGLVDTIKDTVFRDVRYEGKDAGNVTIFLGDTRVTTNVVDADGNRALGTRVSEEVSDGVLTRGEPWMGRAFVVNDWYLTVYEPIRDLDSRVIGMLYVGLLERRFTDIRDQLVRSLLVVTGLGVLGALFLTSFLAWRLTRPLRGLVTATHGVAAGRLDVPVAVATTNVELAELSDSFERMVGSLREKDAQVTAKQTELEQTNQELAALNRNYMEMLGFVSHELKNPLASAILNAYALRDGLLGPLTEAQQQATAALARVLGNFQGMIKNYLDLSRIEKGELEARKRTVRLTEVIEPVVETLHRQAESRRMSIEVAVPRDAEVWADGDLLTVVFDNLLANAIKYGREGGCIRVEAEVGDEGSTCSVWNEGEGIPADKLEELFAKFQRLQTAASGTGRGTGLGLFIVKEVVEKHGGRVWAESEEGRWARFVFTLPPRPAVEEQA